MGAIQGAVNGMLATAGVAATLGKHAKEQSEANKIAKAGTAEKLAIEQEAFGELEEQYNIGEKELNLLKEDKIPVEGTKGEQYTANVFGEDLAPDIQKRTLALNILERKKTAKTLLINAYKEALGEKIVGGNQ